ncbi:hypothetical protein ABW17_29580 [Mycobacterium nebraskense]|uniref:hypothetical protein n=1 Tax=Mycobacterium nebraskense TaxID=244292 RepID=UPI000641FC33|nr:hypothetical protein [Mycobacterium nebraskense]KLO29142.1 hypothetical protein ABW17_29580 [Mycobacterium nebraskense]
MTNEVAQPTLYELAFGCWIYKAITRYDSTVTKLRTATGGQVDPHNLNHRRWLFKWLNQWGCRQFNKADQDTVAGQSLGVWAGKWLTRLPTDDQTLETINESQIGEISNAYEELRWQQAGTRRRAGGAISHVTYGPVGAAKTLFALRPNVCPPWDDYTLNALRLDASGASYGKYLRLVLSNLQAVSIQAGVQIAELPALLGRAKSTPPKLIDEYYWVTITRRVKPPLTDTLRQWVEWANLE